MKIVYISTIREMIEALFLEKGIEDEDLMFEYLNFKLIESWNL